MPSRMLSAIKLASEPSSPISPHSGHSPSPSPEPQTRTRKNNRRKTSQNDGGALSALYQSWKKGRNVIEKRYRANLNDEINCLRKGISSLSRYSSSDAKFDEEGEDSDVEMNSKTAHKIYGHAAILMRALEHIKHLETTTQKLGGEVGVLITREGAFEKLAMSVIIGLGSDRNLTLLPRTAQSANGGGFRFAKPSIDTLVLFS